MNTSCCTNPIRINTLLIKNRIVFPAMCTKYAAPDGGVTERMLRYYEERAKGGAGLVTIEATSVDPTGNSFSRGLSIADDARLPGLTELARRVKRHGARISIQLQHGGRAALPQFSGHAVPLVSAIPGALYLLTGIGILDPLLYLSVVTALLLILSAVLSLWVKKTGSRIFAAL